MGTARVKRVLLLVTTSTHFSDLFRLARAIRATGKYAPSMLFVVRYAPRAQHLRACEDDGRGASEVCGACRDGRY